MMSKEIPEDNCYVRATCNYHYNHKGKDISMAKDEVFLLIKKTTDDWWQVVRSGEHKAFFAPSKYLELTSVSVDAMKSSLRKKVAHQRHLQNQQRLFHETLKQKNFMEAKLECNERSESPPVVHASDIKISQIRREREFHQKEAVDQSKGFGDGSNFLPVSSGYNLKNNNEINSNDSHMNCAVQSTPNFVISDANGNDEMEPFSNKSVGSVGGASTKSNSVYERLSVCSSPEKNRLTGEFESISTHTSKSSLNDCSRSSIESFSQIKVKGNMMGKAASFDVLQSDDENVSSVLNKSYQKAASSEELDHRYRRKELLFQSDRLSHRNRSNSVELKRFDNNLDLSECEKVTSLEKKKCRITRDPMNRRRSWALNEYQSHNSFQKARVNELDASIILDMPPKLPPKLRKNLRSFLSSSSDNINNSDNSFNETRDEGLFRLCEEKALENESRNVALNRKETNKPLVMPRKIPPSDESDIDEKQNNFDESRSKRMPGKISGWKKVQEALANERIVSVHKEDLPSLKEKRVEELIERIENQSKLSEKVVPTISKPKSQFQTPPTPTDPPRRIVFDDWGEYIDRDTGRPFYFNPRTLEKGWKPPRKSICSTLASETSQISSEKSPSLKSLKVPSPVLPPNSNLLWPHRERSFTSSSGHSNNTTMINSKLHSSISLNPDKASHTLPSNPTPSIGIPIPSKGSNTLPLNPISQNEPSPTPKSSRSFFSAISSSLSFIKHSGNNHSNQAATGYSDCPSPASSHSPPQAPPSSAKPLLGGGSNCSTPGTPSSLESLNEEPEHVTLQLALERFHIPKGWIRKYDALSHQVYFESLVTGEKIEKKIPPPKPPRLNKANPKVDSNPSGVPEDSKSLNNTGSKAHSRARHKTSDLISAHPATKSVFYGPALERIIEQDSDVFMNGEDRALLKRQSFSHFASLDKRESVTLYSDIIAEFNERKRFIRLCDEDAPTLKQEDTNQSEKTTQKEVVKTSGTVLPEQSHLICRQRSRSLDLLDITPVSPPENHADHFYRKKTWAKKSTLPQSTFFVDDERSHILEDKPIIAKLAKGVSDAGFAVMDSFSSVPPRELSPPDTPSDWDMLDTDSEDGKWNPAIDKCGTIYVYSATGGESKWTLQEYEDLSPSSLHSPSLVPFEKDSEEALREDILNWRVTMKDGKKAKKSWSTSYAKYYPNMKKNIYGKSFGSITFAKKLNETKKVECFDLVPPCFIDFNLKKPNCFYLRNGDLMEILIQADTPTVATEWTKLLIENDKVQEKNLATEKDKKISKGGDKDKAVSKKDSQDEADATKGIKDSLMLFFKRRIQQETLAKKGIYKDTVFGSTIGDLCQKEKLDTPVFVLQCIKNIEKNKENFKVDGLYRISGNASKIQKIRIEIAQNRYAILEEEKDVHNLTGALKLFFRELKEPLIPFANYVSFIQATDHMKTKSRVEALRIALKKLPTCNRETLKILLDHLLKVNEYEQENRMSIMNLAIVFGPCLLWPETTSGFDLMTDAMLHNRVVESLLSLFDEIFKKK